jgi:tRNA (guanosine-2'-O-)-methyltransferase
MDYSELDRFIAAIGAARTVEKLSPLIVAERRARIERVLSARMGEVHVAVERPADPYNAAAIVRTAEALGALHMHVVAAPERTLHARKTTQGAFRWLHTHHHAELDGLLALLRRDRVRLCGALMTGAYTHEELPVDRPLCLLFGNEGVGLSAAALAACELTFRIPMYGMSESLNLSVAAALTVASVLTRRRALLGRPGDLEGERLLLERARYYARCVDVRTLRAIAQEYE